MTTIVVTMLIIVVLAVAALVFTAFPHRDRPVPGAPWLDRLVRRATDAVPVLGDGDLDRRDDHPDGPVEKPSHR